MSLPFILGSRSPRRRELLAHLVPHERIRVLPPLHSGEEGFDGLGSTSEILQRLRRIARTKNEDVAGQLGSTSWEAVLTADTIVLALDRSGGPVVLGKPDGADWQSRTERWFSDYYVGRTHQVITAVCLATPNRGRSEFHVLTEVRFATPPEGMLEWYVSTGEPLGKAGGYGLQGAGGMFAEAVSGSLSNVIGLPLKETWTALKQLGLLSGPGV